MHTWRLHVVRKYAPQAAIFPRCSRAGQNSASIKFASAARNKNKDEHNGKNGKVLSAKRTVLTKRQTYFVMNTGTSTTTSWYHISLQGVAVPPPNPPCAFLIIDCNNFQRASEPAWDSSGAGASWGGVALRTDPKPWQERRGKRRKGIEVRVRMGPRPHQG
eukprot:6212386-Pleurochrysis_carterae.AAC.1